MHYSNQISIITLNAWHGIAGLRKLLEFFKRYRDETDIFCLQEVLTGANPFQDKRIVPGLLAKIMRLLPNHEVFFSEHTPSELPGYGMVMLTHKNLRRKDAGIGLVSTCTWLNDTSISKDHDRIVQYATFHTRNDQTPFAVMNIHGLWDKTGKGDCVRRLAQMQNIRSIAEKFTCPVIMAGDFNARPDTECMDLFIKAGFRNLITDYGVTDTRTSLYEKEERYADHILVRDDGRLCVKSFCVLPDNVSDHAALRLVCEIGQHLH